MKGIPRHLKTRLFLAVAGVVFAGSLGMAIPATAQSIHDLKKPKSPLVLEAQGSFFVGGERLEQSTVELGSGHPPGHIVLNQMYVQYMVPAGAGHNVPVVMVEGGTLTGKSYETSPDGRMGWAEYFARKRFPVYVADQISRARSGFNQAAYNQARAGVIPASSQPNMPRLTEEAVWNIFRFGPAPGVAYPDQQFPVEAMEEFMKQSVPDLNTTLPVPNPNPKALADLGLALKGAVIIGHSQSSLYSLESALINAKATKGLVALEPGQGCDANEPRGVPAFTNQQIAKLAKVPILVVFGDHLDIPPTPIVDWLAALDNCKAFVDRVNAAGGNAKLLHTPTLGIFGNSHQLMNDKNSDQIAELIIKWIDRNVGGKKVAAKDDKKNPKDKKKPHDIWAKR